MGGVRSFDRSKADKPAEPKNEEKKDEKKSTGSRIGNIGSRFRNKDKADKPADPKDKEKKDDNNSGGPLAGLTAGLGGLTSRIGIGGGDKADGDKKKDQKKADDSGGGMLSGMTSRLSDLTSRIGGGDKPKEDGKPAPAKKKEGGGGFSRFRNKDKADKPADGGEEKKGPVFGRMGRNKPAEAKPATAEAEKSESAGGGLLSKVTSALPFIGGGDGDTKKPPKTSKTRASKVPKVAEGGFQLDLDAKLDILGVVMVFAGLILFITSLSSNQGALTQGINDFFVQLFGWGAIGAPITMIAIGFWLIARNFGENPAEIDPLRLIGVGMLSIGTLMLMMFVETFSDLYSLVLTPEDLVRFIDFSVELGEGGGVIGAELYKILVLNVGELGAVIAIIGWSVVGVMFLTRTSAAELAVFVISVYRSFQISVQRRAQKRRAERLAQLEARKLAEVEQQQQISVSRPAAAELEGGGKNALPQPDSIPIEERSIPIRMGGQMVNAETGAQQQPAVAVSSGGGNDDSSGLFGGIAARLRSAVPSVPSLGSSDDGKSEQPKTMPEENGGAGGNVAAAAAGGLLANRSATNKPEQKSAESTPPVPKPPATNGGQQNAEQAAAAVAAPQASPLDQFRRPQATPAQTNGDNASNDNAASAPANTGGSSRRSRLEELQARARAAEKQGGTLPDKTQPEETPEPEAKPDRIARLDQIRSGEAASARRAAAQAKAEDAEKTEADETDEDDEEVTAAAKPQSSRDLWASLGDKQSKPAPAAEEEKPEAPAVTEPKPPQQRPEPVINVPRPEPQPQPAASSRQQSWRLPDYRTLLSSGSDQEFDRDGLVRKARIIEETLQSFGAPGRVVEINTGPVITQFGVEPDYLTARGGKKSRVKVSAIAALDKDLQLALGARSIRVEAPVPGKGYVGVEVPNDEASLVSLRDVMESNRFTKIKSPLGIGLGQSVDGSPISADLTQMPHLLIAGTTGSGKSVCVNSIIASILIRNSPDQVKFIMVDPKRVELTGYNGIPHLVAPVVVELERIVGVLKWVTREMDDRYKKFSSAGSRNIIDYNNNRDPGVSQMPYIVVIIDELADLMMLAPDETERVITRIAALARATGIHLVIATQRPSVDVVTGLIKANFPARIAFAVAGGVDSRVILDQPGAERLLGKGDMLYMSGDSPAPQRLQGVYVSDMEINNINRFWKAQAVNVQQKPITALITDDKPASRGRSVMPSGERFSAPPPPSTQSEGSGQRGFWESTSPANPDNHSAGYGMSEREQDEDRDELYSEAVELVRKLNKASVSLLQRRLRIGYTRAARLIDVMEAEGIVGPPTEGSKPREVLKPEKKS